MSVESTATKVVYEGNGLTTEWPVPFQYNKPEHLALTLDSGTKQTDIPSNFQITVNASGDTSITYPVSGLPVAAGHKLVIRRQTPRTQIVDLMYGGAFSPKVIEQDGFDRVVMMIQELFEEVNRAVKLSLSATEAAPSVEGLLSQIAELTAQAEQKIGEAQAAIEAFNELQLAIPVPGEGDAGKTLYVVQDDDGKAHYVLMKSAGGTGGEEGGWAEYTIQAREASGLVHVRLADLGHPAMPGICNPVINIMSLHPYSFVLRSRDAEGFTVQIYRANGTPGVDFAEFVEFGPLEFGAEWEWGQGETGSDVELAVSIPLPPQKI